MTVTIPEPGDDYPGRFDFDRLLPYEVAAVPAPANLAQGQPIPTRHVHEIKVKGDDGEWRSL